MLREGLSGHAICAGTSGMRRSEPCNDLGRKHSHAEGTARANALELGWAIRGTERLRKLGQSARGPGCCQAGMGSSTEVGSQRGLQALRRTLGTTVL